MIIITLFITTIIRTNLKEGGTVDEDGGSVGGGGGGGGEQVSKCRHRKQHRRGEHMPSTLAHCLNSFLHSSLNYLHFLNKKRRAHVIGLTCAFVQPLFYCVCKKLL